LLEAAIQHAEQTVNVSAVDSTIGWARLIALMPLVALAASDYPSATPWK
jgi:hypothetical protein